MDHFVEHSRGITAFVYSLTYRAMRRMQEVYSRAPKNPCEPAELDFEDVDALNDFLDGDSYLETMGTSRPGLSPMLEAKLIDGQVRIRLYKLHDLPFMTVRDLVNEVHSSYQAIGLTMRAVGEFSLVGLEYA